MTLPTDDRVGIYELIARHGQLTDAREFGRLDELFTDDFVFNVEAPSASGIHQRDSLPDVRIVPARRALWRQLERSSDRHS